MTLTTTSRRVLVFEVNEISWELMQPWLESGDLPNFQRLKAEGAWGRTWTNDPGGSEGLLEPWVTWTTLYTGVPHTEHGVKFLEQPPESIKAARLWDLAAQAGKRIGIYGSVGSWPPRPVDGFFVPGSFAPDNQTFPERLKPIQDLNLVYTRSHAPGASGPGMKFMIACGLRLLNLGLNASTALEILGTLVEVKRHPERDWKKVSLQPVVNMAFFEKLYRETRPDFATFHTNHVAHYQHRFMRAWKPEAFPDSTDGAEVTRFRDAIRYGYLVADRLLGRFFRLCERDKNVVLVVASSMGQKAYIPPRYASVAPPTCRIRSIERLVEILGLKDRCTFFSTMAPQWNLRIPDAEARKQAMHHLHQARFQPADKSMYSAIEVQDAVVVTPISHHGIGPGTTCTFPSLPGAPSLPFEQMVVQADDTRKSGCHDPVGMLAFYGGSSPAGLDFGRVNTLDVAPTLLKLMGLAVPAFMNGQVIEAVLQGANTTANTVGVV
jgi:hypothetical protein